MSRTELRGPSRDVRRPTVDRPRKYVNPADLPSVLYTRYVSSADAPMGLLGRKTPVEAVYAVEEPTAEDEVPLEMRWPQHAVVLDERRGVRCQVSFSEAVSMGCHALVRSASENRTAWRILDTEIIAFVGEEAERSEAAAAVPPETTTKRMWERARTSLVVDYDASLDDALLSHFGKRYYDPVLDRISVTIVSIRTGRPPEKLLNEMISKLTSCKVFAVSGCWLSTNKSFYRTTARWKYCGLKPRELFSHDGKNNERHVVRHDPMRCEMCVEEHSRCCRPSHLCYGSTKANVKDMRLRQGVSDIVNGLHDDRNREAFRNLIDSFGKLVLDEER